MLLISGAGGIRPIRSSAIDIGLAPATRASFSGKPEA